MVTFLLLYLLLMVRTTTTVVYADDSWALPTTISGADNNNPKTIISGGKICSSIDVRNSPINFIKLDDCAVIEGSLHINLIENATAEAYQGYSFPLLREITDYMVLFRVSGLQTLARLFPNLSVIRGKKLFANYALVVYEMMELQVRDRKPDRISCHR
jgi:hypothetical protein